MRPQFFEYCMNIVQVVASRATCNRGKCGAITVQNSRILTTGYVGSAPGLPHCDDVGHLFRTVIHVDGSTKQHCVRSIHAEQNAIAQAARFGISLEGCDLYSTMFPCFDCAKLIVAVGIKHVYALFNYQAGTESQALFEQSGVGFFISNKDVPQY